MKVGEREAAVDGRSVNTEKTGALVMTPPVPCCARELVDASGTLLKLPSVSVAPIVTFNASVPAVAFDHVRWSITPCTVAALARC